MSQLRLPKTSTEYEEEIARLRKQHEEEIAVWRARALAAEQERDDLEDGVLCAVCFVIGHAPDENYNGLSCDVPCLRCGAYVDMRPKEETNG